MNPLHQALEALVADLGALRTEFALIGGLAVGVRAEPRFTRDADVAVAVQDDRSAERLVRDLGARGYRAVLVLEHDAHERLSAVRLTPATSGSEGLVLDLLFASSGIEREVVAGAELIEIMPGLRMPVASTGHLIALKLLSRDDEARPQDAADLKALAKAASPADLAAAKDALALITSRGFHRGRDLAREARKLFRS